MIVFLDRQHAGKPDKIDDRGASISNPPEAFGLGSEALYTGYLSLMIEEALLENGVKVIPISDGVYTERHKRVNEYSKRFQEKQVYLALHLNCGGGDYASFFHMGSENGAALASSICDKLRDAALPGLVRCLPKVASREDWTKNAWYTIRGVEKPIAICCEPLFMDVHKNLLTFENLRKIAKAIANGIISWSL